MWIPTISLEVVNNFLCITVILKHCCLSEIQCDVTILWGSSDVDGEISYKSVLHTQRHVTPVFVLYELIVMLHTQACLVWRGVESTSMATLSVTGGKSACGWHVAPLLSRRTLDCWTMWWVKTVWHCLHTATVDTWCTQRISLKYRVLPIQISTNKWMSRCYVSEGSRWSGCWVWHQTNCGQRMWGGSMYPSSHCREGSSC